MLVLGLLLLAGSAMASVESIVVDGWKFTADLGDEWRYDPTAEKDIFNDWLDCISEDIVWSGTDISKPFFIPKNPTEFQYSGLGGKSGFIDIVVLQIPSELKELDTTSDILWGAADSAHCYTTGEGSDEDVTFNGLEAHLWELDESLDGREHSFGIIAVKLSDSDVAIIDVERWDDSGENASDAIYSFTITPV
jgi:hypothetical protein